MWYTCRSLDPSPCAYKNRPVKIFLCGAHVLQRNVITKTISDVLFYPCITHACSTLCVPQVVDEYELPEESESKEDDQENSEEAAAHMVTKHIGKPCPCE